MIDIELTQIGIEQQKLKCISNQFNHIKGNLSSLNQQLNSRVQNRNHIGQSLNKAIHDVEKLRGKTSQLCEVLNYAVTKYQLCEASITKMANFKENPFINPEDQLSRKDFSFVPFAKVIPGWKYFIFDKLPAIESIGISAVKPNGEGVCGNSILRKCVQNQILGGDSLLDKYRTRTSQVGGHHVQYGYHHHGIGSDNKTEGSVNFDLIEGNVGAAIKAETSAYFGKSTAHFSVGDLDSTGSVTVGKAEIAGELRFDIMQKGSLAPALVATVGAEVVGIEGEFNTRYGNDDFNVSMTGVGKVGVLKAEATAAWTSDNVIAKAEIGAAALKGEAKSGFTLFGIKVEATASGELFAAGASIGGELTSNSIEFGGKLSLLAGLGLDIKISW